MLQFWLAYRTLDKLYTRNHFQCKNILLIIVRFLLCVIIIFYYIHTGNLTLLRIIVQQALVFCVVTPDLAQVDNETVSTVKAAP